MWRAHLKPGFRRLTSQFSVGPRSPEARGSARAFAGRASRTGREAAKPPVEAQAKEPTEVKEPPKEEPKAQVTDLPDGLIVLPLLRKPAFPSFKQILQVSEPEVIDLLKTYRSKNQFEYIGGFLMKDAAGQDPPRAFGSSEPSGLRRDAGKAESVNQLEEVGTLLQVLEIISFSNNAGGQITVMPKYRVRKTGTLTQSTPYVPLPVVRYRALEPIQAIENVEEAKSALAPLVALLKKVINASPLLREQHDQVIQYFDMNDPVKVADLAAGLSTADRSELQGVLEEQDLKRKIEKVTVLLQRDLSMVKMQSEVKSKVEEKVLKEQKQKILMDQMRQIQKELGIEKDEKQALTTQFKEAIQDKEVPEEVQKIIDSEIAKLNSLEPSSPEFNVCRTYLEWLTCLPWGEFTAENRDIKHAETVLDEDHYGLEDVKERILEHIAVSFLKDSTQGKIMCLVGPPGVGKTSVGKSVARALGRKFYRFSVGGMSDVVEIKGHRRTYVGAMPGKLIQCLKSTGCSNPVVLIDEIDKLGRDMRGDPSSALLEVLDPEQNGSFRDHYLDVPVDLSNILFLSTANMLDTIPGPLLDRMEIIRLAGYVYEEKLAIASKYLIPQTEEQSGIGTERLNLQEEALQKMIKDYAREAGVRNLRQLLEKVSRKVALDLVRKKKSAPNVEQGPALINLENLSTYIGQPLHMSDRLYIGTPPGVVMGLAWTANGGATLYVEARGRLPCGRVQGGMASLSAESAKGESKPGSGHMQVTGQLGSVMSESSSISLTYARLFMRELDPTNTFLDVANIHLHVPEGATPKDGPSAGVTMTSALLSCALERPLLADVAMTGELTLMGKVLKVGGIKEKVIAARREGVKTLLLPLQNEADYMEIKEYLRDGLTAHFVDHFDDAYRLMFDPKEVPSLKSSRGLPVITVQPPTIEKAEEPVEIKIHKMPEETDTGLKITPLPRAKLVCTSAMEELLRVVQAERFELQKLLNDHRLTVEASLTRLDAATTAQVMKGSERSLSLPVPLRHEIGSMDTAPTLQPMLLECDDPIPENPFHWQEEVGEEMRHRATDASHASASSSSRSQLMLSVEFRLPAEDTSSPRLQESLPSSTMPERNKSNKAASGAAAVDLFLGEPQVVGWERWKKILKASIDYVAAILVLLNSIVLMLELEFKGNAAGAKMGLSSGPTLDEIEPIFQGLDRFFVFIFLAELLVRIMVEQCDFCKEWTNYLDASLVILGLVDFGFSLQVTDGDVVPKDIVLLRLMRALKSLRAIRMMRSFRLFRGLRLLVKACQCFLPSLCWAMVLLGVFMTMGALIMGNLLQSFVTDEEANFEDREWIWMRYGTAYRATYTLYEITFAGNWPTNARPVMERVSHVFVIFFVLYITIIAFAVIRVISAVFLKDTLDAAQNDAEHLVVDRLRKKAEYVEKLEAIFRAIDDSGDGIITEARMNEILSNDKVAAYFQTLDLDVHEGAALFHLLDNGDGEVTLDEFIDGIMRCKGPARAIDQVAMHADLKQLDIKLAKMARYFNHFDLSPRSKKDRSKKERSSVAGRSQALRGFLAHDAGSPQQKPR